MSADPFIEGLILDAFTRQSDRDKQVKIGPSEVYQYLTDENLTRTLNNFFSQIEVTDGCWYWQGTKARGYGLMSVRVHGVKKQARVHRLSWEIANGHRVPEGLTLDHTCQQPSCVNPDHLEPVTSKENLLRRWRRYRANLPEHCKHGHEFTPENTRVISRGTRTCITCLRLADSKSYWNRKATAHVC